MPPNSEQPFFYGINLPWNAFGWDIGGGAWDAGWFDRVFSEFGDRANTVRFFLHADGRGSPQFAQSGMVISHEGKRGTLEQDLLELVELTHKHSLILQLTLWSFDMCKDNKFGQGLHASLIKNVEHTKSYITKSLVPMLQTMVCASRPPAEETQRSRLP